MLHLTIPNKSNILGYQVVLSNSSIHYTPLEIAGHRIIYKPDSIQSWMKSFPKLHHAQHKLLILPFY